jgi:hypothetical protein
LSWGTDKDKKKGRRQKAEISKRIKDRRNKLGQRHPSFFLPISSS